MSADPIQLDESLAQRTDRGDFWCFGPYCLTDGCGHTLLKLSLSDQNAAFLSDAGGNSCLTHIHTNVPFYLFCDKGHPKQHLTILSPQKPEGWTLYLV